MSKPTGSDYGDLHPVARRRIARPLLRLACLASFSALAFSTWQAASFYAGVVSTSKRQVIDMTVKGAAQIDAELRVAMGAAQGVADDLSSGRLEYGRVDARLKKTRKDFPFLLSADAAVAPGPDSLWYGRVVASGKPAWTAPYYRKASNSLTAVYAVPFFKNGKAIGAASVSLSLDEIRRMIENLDLGPSGFPELISADGTYLYHPHNEYVLAQKTILDLAVELHDKDRSAVGPRAMRGEGGIIDHVSTNTGLRTWFVYQPVASSGWSLQNTFVRADLPFDVDVMRHRLFRVMLSAVAFLLLLAGLFLKADELERRHLWTLSILSSLMFAACVALIWSLALKLDSHSRTAGTVISDMSSVTRLRNHYAQQCAARHAEPPIFVPTGVFLEMARFLGATDIQVTGYVWQRYDDATTKGLNRGFVLRDAVDVNISEPYRQRDGDGEVLRWPFQAVLHQNMSLAKFPLDQEMLSLKLRHKDLDHNVVLTPDLGSYKILAATAKPGLSSEFKIAGWRVLKTFFGLGGTIDSTSFGLSRSIVKEDFPGLQFNVLLRRNLLDAFISNLGPIIIAMILLFALQMVMTDDEKLASIMQTSSGRLVNICVSMFFVIVFAHISVRRGMAAEEIFYLEYFYFVTYLMILWVAINSIAYYKMKSVWWIQHEENMILKLLFWPVVTGFLFISSVGTFY